jgi:hypothetical protein
MADIHYDGGPRGGGILSTMLALLALAVSLASAGWSVFAYWKSSEVRPLPFTELAIITEGPVAQISLEVSIANLAYGEYDDVARDQFLLLDNGQRQLLFVARESASVRDVGVDTQGVAETLQYPCRKAGEGVAACVSNESPVVSLPAGAVETIHPIFEIAEQNCGLESCVYVTAQQVAEFLTGAVNVTYTVVTMRDGNHALPTCRLDLREGDQAFLVANGWFRTSCAELPAR